MRPRREGVLSPDPNPLAHFIFRTSLFFFVVVALIGVLLRSSWLSSWPRFEYSHWLHAHSHTAFLGFFFNAFLAFVIARFVSVEERVLYRRLFIGLVGAVLGMLVSFPLQGYGPVSIAFSTVHMVGTGALAWRLWFYGAVSITTRPYLRASLVWLLLSGIGPLGLAPLAAQGLRDTPAYSMCVYFYLHAQYNGWFVFFLLALVMETVVGPTLSQRGKDAFRRAFPMLSFGVTLTFAHSALWLDPPVWVRFVAFIGATFQGLGAGLFLFGLAQERRARWTTYTPFGRFLLWLALGAWLLKLLLQVLAPLPTLSSLAGHRFVVIAFLHLIFLGSVVPVVFAQGLQEGWLCDTKSLRGALAGFFVSAAAAQWLLVALSLGWSASWSVPGLLLLTAAAMALSAVTAVAVGLPKIRR